MHRRYEPHNIPIEVLRSFVSILDTGSFTKAASQLHITQPAISAQIKRMQTLVGEELFHKEGTGIALTDKGETVARYARRILSLNDQILWSGRSEKKFRIGIPQILGAAELSALKKTLELENFHSVQIICDRSASLLKRLGAGFFDAALAFTPSQSGTIAPVISWKEPLVWVCHPDLVVSPGAPLPLLSWPNTVTDHVALQACEHAQTSYTTEFSSDQLITLTEALRLKLGYLCMAQRMAPAGLKIANDYFLPKLPAINAGIYKNADTPDIRLDALVKSLGKVFAPASTDTLKHDQTAALRSPRLQPDDYSAVGAQAKRVAPGRKVADPAEM